MRIGTVLIVVGILVAVLGAVLRFAPWLVSWFGKLPGDLRFGNDTTRVFIPITSSLLVSLILSLILGLVSRLRG